MVVECPGSWVNCERAKEWHISINIIAITFMLFQIAFSGTILGLLILRIKNKRLSPHYKVLAAQLALATLRTVWWSMNFY